MVRLVTEPTPHRDGQRLRTMHKYVRVCRDKGGREERVTEGGREVEGKGKERKGKEGGVILHWAVCVAPISLMEVKLRNDKIGQAGRLQLKSH